MMDPDESSYFKYLHDIPNAYLLENSEVGLFPAEPIFTEMGPTATDWQPESFPLIPSLITEETELEPIELDEPQENSTFVVITTNSEKLDDELITTVLAKKCTICSYLHEDIEVMNEHVKTHSTVSVLRPQNEATKTIFVCSECKTCCSTWVELKNHMIQSHKLAPSDPNLDLVKKQERTLQQFKCTVKGCKAKFPTDEWRLRHEKLHNKFSFNCSECEKVCNLWSTTRKHMLTEHQIDFGTFVCPMCNNFRSYQSVQVLRHMMIHSDDKPFLCSDCGKSFRQLAQLKNHEVSHKLPEDVPVWSKVKKCNKCERFYANSKSLRNHIKTVHEKIKPFICNICGHKSSRKAMLELHMRQHTAAKPHKCDYCEFRTGDPNSLRKHTMKHLGVVNYKCPHCPYSCIQSGSIKSHFRHRHKDMDLVFSCKYCSFTTINESLLNVHVNRHETGKDLEKTDDGGKNEELEIDEESCFLTTSDAQCEETVDNGGITIPAGLEMPIVTINK